MVGKCLEDMVGKCLEDMVGKCLEDMVGPDKVETVYSWDSL